ncbi:MAG: hypothetical protein ING75_13700 [Rhodocyclaceae bacterium]|nr:hypothetical protein [Rhodocyclaceae bacterium]
MSANAPQVTINAEQRLFVIPCGGGYSCYGFDNCFNASAQLVERLNKHLSAKDKLAGKQYVMPDPAKKETLEAYAHYQSLLDALRNCPAASKATWFDPKTPAKVKKILEDARESRHILRLFQGDAETGRDWAEENDCVGRIGRTGGILKTPILLEPLREHGDIRFASGGGAILTANILRIADVTTNEELYRAQNYQLPQLVIGESTKPGYTHTVTRDGKEQAAFKRYEDAARYVAFMIGATYVQFPYRTVAEYQRDFAEAA